MNKVSQIEIAAGYPRGSSLSGALGGEGENVITVQRIVRAVRRRLGVMLAVFALTFAVVAFQTFQLKAAYTATSRVIINSRDQNVVDIGAVLSGMPANVGAIETEAEVLRSRTLIEKLVKRLDLLNSPEFNGTKAVPSDWDKTVVGVKPSSRACCRSANATLRLTSRLSIPTTRRGQNSTGLSARFATPCG